MNDKSSAANGGTEDVSTLTRFRRTLLGGRRNPFDPKVFQRISLIAFFAWVGMGADGITSANYGPEEAYHALHSMAFLGPVLGIVIALTVLIISASYTQIIEQFPSGGGGYLVASKLLHPVAGVVSGSALVVDYVLTIAVSVVSGVASIYSLAAAPVSQELKVVTAIGVILLLALMNLRGVKESVITLLPVFMIFVVSHVVILAYGLIVHVDDLPARAVQGFGQATATLNKDGLGIMIVVFLGAFSMGAGTFTGIEAVSNGMPVLREPRVQTGKKTMAYMAASLAFLSAALFANYYLFNTQPMPGKTLNAALFSQILHSWRLGAWHLGDSVLWVTLISAALLLFVAAQTGFIDGPRVLANMAQDSWVPHRFSHLSERLVTQNGVLLMGAAAVFFIIYSRGNITVLITLYAINVFITFSLSQLGMLRLWLSRRKTHEKWLSRFVINGIGLLVCASLLVLMVFMKFFKGGWLTLLLTSGVVALCFLIRRHYREISGKVEKIDEILMTLSFGDASVTPQPLDPNEPTAVILVEKYSGTGIHVMLNVQRLFGTRFKQYVFVSVGAIDSGHFKGVDELGELEKEVHKQAEKYVTLARSYGLKAMSRTACAIDYLGTIEQICLDLHREFSNSVFFAARLLFWKDTLWSRLLHNETPLSLQRRLMFHGLQFVVLPVRLQ
ncbi:MAG: APC family permease [bacterium]|nr:APC family permease [bacterium]